MTFAAGTKVSLTDKGRATLNHPEDVSGDHIFTLTGEQHGPWHATEETLPYAYPMTYLFADEEIEVVE